jgi:DNA polymerase III subunit delta'
MSLADVLGHERLRAALTKALGNGHLSSALLLTGPEGVGKRLLAIELGRTLVCEEQKSDACGRCSSCERVGRALDALRETRERAVAAEEPLEFNLRLHPDLVVVEPSPETIRVEQARAIVSEVGERAFEGRGRAVIIDDAHALTEQAANALLKSLEEPPDQTHFFLVTSSPEALLPTIRSRCARLRFTALPEALVAKALVSRWGVAPEEARLRARLSSGSLKAALAFESESYRDLREEMLALLETWKGLGEIERLDAAQKLAEMDDSHEALRILRSLLRDVAVLGEGAEDDRALNVDVVDRLRALGQGTLAESAARLAEHVGRIARALDANAHRGLAMELLVDGIDAKPGLRGEDWAW